MDSSRASRLPAALSPARRSLARPPLSRPPAALSPARRSLARPPLSRPPAALSPARRSLARRCFGGTLRGRSSAPLHSYSAPWAEGGFRQ
ncbi:hypothetical protein NHX12_014866 [Muraenolepis orangiensis]|uniref:Uncharacterized protein n=1 Tax=Muraenolepis orangiensis TaxID=630683 RepID=A0A9Q0DAW7_9TELE|nr:hypothetical protein NHX12_014866 [Muraenolepis orangiensis]